MSYDPNDPHERLQMRVAEHTDEYLLVARIGGETRVLMSDHEWAAAVQDQIGPAIEEAERQAKRAPSEDRRHGAHGKDSQAPTDGGGE
jgi:hypothetical protein